MWKSFVLLWKNIFNYTGRTTRKDYWLGLIANVIAMYIFTVPVALISVALPFIPNMVWIALFIIIMQLPALSAYVRRAIDLNLCTVDTILAAICVPGMSAILMGCFGSSDGVDKSSRLPWTIRLIEIGMGLFIYGGFLGILFFGSPDALFPLPIAGLGLMTVSILIGYFKVKA